MTTSATIVALKAQHPDWSYQQIADVLQVSRNVVAGALFRNAHGSSKRRVGRHTKLAEEQVRQLRAAPWGSVGELAKRLGVSIQAASRARNFHTWTHVA